MKMHKATRMFSLLLAGLMAVSLTSCGDDAGGNSSPGGSDSNSAGSSQQEESLYYNKEGYPICDDPITVTASGAEGRGVDWNELLVFQTIEDKLGIHIECNPYPADAWETQLTLMMTTNDLPDIICQGNISNADANQYGQEGYLLDMSQYLDLMPNFTARMDQDPALAAYLRDENGAIYGISKTRDSLCSRAVAMTYLNNNWLEAVGMEYPQTTEELYNVLKAFKEQDANENGDPNDEIPLSLTFDQYSGMRGEYVLRSAFGIYGYQSNYQLQTDDAGKVYLAEATDNWKEYVKYMNRLYEDGLLDQDSFIQTNEEYQAKILNNTTGMFSSWSTLTLIFNTQSAECYKDFDFFTGVSSDLTDETVYPLWNTVTAGTILNISADTQYPEALCRMVDYFYTEEGMILSTNGLEGVTFNYKEDAYGVKIFDKTGFWEDSGCESTIDWLYKSVILSSGGWEFVQYNPSQRVVDESTDEQLEEYIADADPVESANLVINAYKEAARRKVKSCDDYPNVVYTSEENDQRNKYFTAIQNYIQSTKAEFIIGTQDIDANWDTFLQTLDSMGLQELLAIEQAAYDRYAVNLK